MIVSIMLKGYMVVSDMGAASYLVCKRVLCVLCVSKLSFCVWAAGPVKYMYRCWKHAHRFNC
jgi:hypothetical protein